MDRKLVANMEMLMDTEREELGEEIVVEVDSVHWLYLLGIPCLPLFSLFVVFYVTVNAYVYRIHLFW